MKAFEYAGPSTVEEAVKSLAGAKSPALLSGGTDLLSRMKDYVTSPDRVVYLKGVKPLAGISEEKGGLVIGAGTRLADLLSNEAVSKQYPALRQAALEVGTPQIRNMATVGGNLLQRPRCWYFRAGFGLLAKKDGKSLVRSGDNRYHSIFQTDGDALFAHPSSLSIPLVALGATATIVGEKGERTIPIQALYQVPKPDEDRELTVGANEVLTKITIPESKGKNASYEARQKRAHDWPLVLGSVVLDLEGNEVRSVRIVLGGVAPTPWRSEAAEAAIKGKAITLETATAAAEAAVKEAKPLSMNAYKISLTKTVVKRALLAAVGNRYWEEV
jgi:xanthine dehydrogenase YagS FAD-binding subunit